MTLFLSGVLFMLGVITAGLVVRLVVGAWERRTPSWQRRADNAAAAARLEREMRQRKPWPRVERAVRLVGLSVIALVVFCGLVGLISH